MSAPLNPVEVEARIRELATQISRGVDVVDEAYRAFLAADRAFDDAWAHAYLKALGNMEDRKQTARAETMELRKARDVADAAYKYADRRSKALESELRAMQSVGASVRNMYTVAGRGEW